LHIGKGKAREPRTLQSGDSVNEPQFFMRTGNPMLNDSTFSDVAVRGVIRPMTLGGVVHKSFILLALVAGTAAFAWTYSVAHPAFLYPALMGGAVGGLIIGVVTAFKKAWAPATAPIYAILQGLFIGTLSVSLEARFPGIVLQSVCLTFGVAFALLGAYQCRLIRASQTFRSVIVAATGGILIVYLANLVFNLLSHRSFPFLQDSGPLGIGFSLFVVAIAALNLVLDFDFIENGVAAGVPKWMEWYAAFGLTVTLVWLYIEILRLLSKLRRND
jgi:uncharacterized YccA/Bax inhibitor family protein